MDEEHNPRREGDAANALSKEDLSPYSQDELEVRLALLRSEIKRVEDHMAQASAHRKAADALFGGPKS